MKAISSSLTVHEGTTSTEIAAFLQQAGEAVSRTDPGLRARHGVGKDGKKDGTVVLYVRQLCRPKSLQGWIALLIRNVRAAFDAKEAYQLAASTLLDRARVAGSREMAIVDGTKLCRGIARVMDGRDGRLGLAAARQGWEQAFTAQARMASGAVLAGLRKDIANLEGLPAASQRKGQTPRVIIGNGMKDLAYLQALLSLPAQNLGREEKLAIQGLFCFLSVEFHDDSVLAMQQDIENLTRVTLSSAALCPDSEAGRQFIGDAIKFASAWLKHCRAKPAVHQSLAYSHMRTIDYLSGRILSAYLPADVCLADAQSLIFRPTSKNPGTLYTSISQAMNAKLREWIDHGKQPGEFFEQSSLDMQWRLADEAE